MYTFYSHCFNPPERKKKLKGSMKYLESTHPELDWSGEGKQFFKSSLIMKWCRIMFSNSLLISLLHFVAIP